MSRQDPCLLMMLDRQRTPKNNNKKSTQRRPLLISADKHSPWPGVAVFISLPLKRVINKKLLRFFFPFGACWMRSFSLSVAFLMLLVFLFFSLSDLGAALQQPPPPPSNSAKDASSSANRCLDASLDSSPVLNLQANKDKSEGYLLLLSSS